MESNCCGSCKEIRNQKHLTIFPKWEAKAGYFYIIAKLNQEPRVKTSVSCQDEGTGLRLNLLSETIKKSEKKLYETLTFKTLNIKQKKDSNFGDSGKQEKNLNIAQPEFCLERLFHAIHGSGNLDRAWRLP